MDLFEYTEMQQARDADGSKAQRVLEALKKGPLTTNDLLGIDSHRFACEIYDLRKQGWEIKMQKLTPTQAIYTLVGYRTRLKLKKGMKEAYYQTPHWRETRLVRLATDDHICTLCKTDELLQVHHWEYNLFAESQNDLQTFCQDCHSRLHGLVKIAFPTHVSPDVFERIPHGKKDKSDSDHGSQEAAGNGDIPF